MPTESKPNDTATAKKPNALFAWQDSKTGLVVIAVIDFIIAYAFISFAINSGNWIDYLIAVIFFALGVGNGVKFVRKMSRSDS